MTKNRGIRETPEQIDASLADISTADAAYAAGFFDGEGCVCIYETKTKYGWRQVHFSARVSNTDPRPLAWLKGKFGGQITRRGGVREKEGHRELYTWYVLNGRAAAFFQRIQPFCRIKAEQITLAFEFRRTYWSRKDGKIVVPDEVHSHRQELIARIKELKRRAFLPHEVN